jgi:hypothetical protein
MDTDEIVQHAVALRKRIQAYGRDEDSGSPADAAQAQVCEFLHTYAGAKSAFLKLAQSAQGFDSFRVKTLTAIMDSFVEYLESGLATGLSPERRAQLDVVSDILEQAQSILDNNSNHPAAAAVLVGASLEEYLRSWVEDAGLSIAGSKPGIDAYCKALRTEGLISKQDVKDITSWAGIRNHAAHGEWEEVADRGRIRLMLEGVNLFMRQKTG